MNKIELIEKITDFHPDYGTEKGLSWYTGGMKDTGEWYFRKLLKMSEEELKDILEEFTAIKNKPKPVYTEEEKRKMETFVPLKGGGIMSLYEKEQWERFGRDLEYKILFGKKE